MKSLKAVLQDFKTYLNYKTKEGRKHLLITLGVVLGALLLSSFFGGSDTAPAPETASKVEVEVLTISALSAEARFDTIGKVEAISEANLQVEAPGRITRVSVNIGDTVASGQVLATIENNAQAAQLTQAQGSYEAALAASAQSTVGVGEAQTALEAAKNNAVTTGKSAYSASSNVVFTTIDTFFSSPEGSLPGLKLDGRGNTQFLNNERVAYQQLLKDWQARSASMSPNSDLNAELAYARGNVERTVAFLDVFITIFNSGSNGNYSDAELQALSTTFTNQKAALRGTLSSIDGAVSSLAASEDAVKRASISATGGSNSAADAQVKIALGSLQAAQANYQKTIVRSPIAGVVNAFYLKEGDFASPGQPAGIVANNNGLQIKTYVNEADSANLNVGDTVSIESTKSGVITAKASALDPENGKVAVVVGVNADSGLTNGATVKVTFSQVSTVEQSDRILVPLSALKLNADDTNVFTVTDGKLSPIVVTTGQLVGENIELLSGVSKETPIVIDARGLKAGQEVVIKE